MIRWSLVLAALVGVAGLAQASIPSAPPTDTGAGFSPHNTYLVFFETGKYSLTPEAQVILHRAAQGAQAMRPTKVRVTLPISLGGATALSQNRARAVRTELARDGVTQLSIGNSYSSAANPIIRTWLDRAAIVEVSPASNMDSDGRVG